MSHRVLLFTLLYMACLVSGGLGISAHAQEDERVFMIADFNLATDHSLLPGEDNVIFYGDSSAPDPGITFDGFGASGEPGDEALELLFELTDPPFFGFLLQLAPDGGSHDISSYEVLEFDMRLGGPGGFDDWVVRLEDRDGEAEWNNVSLPIENLTEDWQTFSFPLSDFLTNTDAQIPDLTQVFQIVFTTNNTPSGSIFFDLLVDNITIKGTSDSMPPEPVLPDPIASFTQDFEDGTLVNSNGGELFLRAAQGNPFVDELSRISVDVVQDSLAEGGQSAYVSGGFEVTGDGFSYIEVRFPLNENVDIAHDISGFDVLQIVARVGEADNATWGLRMRDLDTASSDFLNNTVFIQEQLSSDYSVIDIPLSEFEQDRNGAAIDLSQVSQFFMVVDGGPGPLSLQADLYVDQVSLLTETDVREWSLY